MKKHWLQITQNWAANMYGWAMNKYAAATTEEQKKYWQWRADTYQQQYLITCDQLELCNI